MSIMEKTVLTAAVSAGISVMLMGLSSAAVLAIAAGSARGDAPPPFRGGRPVVAGKVTAVDAKDGTLTIIGPGGNNVTINVSADTSVHGLVSVKASALAKGEKVFVDGVVSGVTAKSIIAGDLQDALPGPPPPRDGGGPGGGDDDQGDNNAGPDDGSDDRPGPPPGGGPDDQGGPGRPRPLIGTITGVKPLTISIDAPEQDGITITVTVPASAKVGKLVEETLADIKVGDRIFASGEPNGDGYIDASKIAVNIALPRRPRRPEQAFGGRQFGGRNFPGQRGMNAGPPPPDGGDNGYGPPPPGDQGGPPPQSGGAGSDQGGPPPPGGGPGGDQGGPPPQSGGAGGDQGGPPPPGGGPGGN